MIRSMKTIDGKLAWFIDGQRVSREEFAKSFRPQLTTPLHAYSIGSQAHAQQQAEVLPEAPVVTPEPEVPVVTPEPEAPKRRGRPPNSAKEPIDG